ncbi:MAG TPA: ChrR family anti-sigma-E factor [Terricaulis sp.]|nr:ChrR family anti-sigma-E factor [Terricaulis sp.]
MILHAPTPPPTHHPSLETLTRYAAGTLRAGFDFVTAVHVSKCLHCREQVAALECVGGALLHETTGAPVQEDALARTLARLDEPAFEPEAPSLEQLLSDVKRRWVAPGIWVAKVNTPHDKGDRVFILSAAPGAATALHAHHGDEYTQILSGVLGDGETRFRAGDFVERGPEHMHQPHTIGQQPCVCLFATRGRLKPADMIGRLAFMIADV